MYLFTEKEQPYGLLSNFATTPIHIDGTWWQSVNEYIFTNMVTNPLMKQKMRRDALTTLDPFSSLEDIESDFLHKKFIDGLKVALNSAINERPDLQNMLETSSSITYRDEREIEDFLNQKRNELLDRRHIFPLMRTKRIIDGVTRALKAGRRIIPSSTLVDLKEYETALPPPDIKEDDEIFSHLHELVPYIQFKIDNEHVVKQYKKELESFKKYLFDQYITNKLMVDYPDLDEEDYQDAREQLFEDMGTGALVVFMDDIYKLFLDGKLPDEVLQSVEAPPKEPDLHFVSKGLHEIKIKSESHPLSPYGMGQVFIDGIEYRSPLHYTYGEMMNLLRIPIDINAIRKDELSAAFQWYHSDYLAKTRRMYADEGIKAKLVKYPVLVHLLKTTGNQEILWGDTSDPILGVGRDGKGENAVGQILMKYRTSMNPQDRRVSSYASPMDNIFVKQWALMRLEDLYNSMNTMVNPTTGSLEDLYRFPTSNSDNKFKGLDPADRRIIAASFPELTDEMLMIAWPLMYPQMYVIKRLTDSNLVNVIVKAQEIYLGEVPTNDEKHAVNKYLQEYFGRHSDNMKLNNSADFAGRILSGNKYTKVQSSYDIFSYALNPRVFYWLDLAKAEN